MVSKKSFINALKNGDAKTVEKYIKGGNDVNFMSTTYGNATPLLIACEAGHIDCVKLLVDAGAYFYIYIHQSQWDWIAKVIRCSDVELVKVFVNAPLKVNEYNRDRVYETTLLHCAIEMLDVESVTGLLDAGADPEDEDVYSRSAIIHAADKNNLAIIKELIRHGADVNKYSINGHTALQIAIVNRKKHIEDALREAGADPDYEYYFRSAKVLHAAEAGLDDRVSDLLKDDCDINKARHAINKFLVAVKNGNTAIVNSFIHAGIDVNCMDEDGNTPLIHAVIGNYKHTVELLLENGANQHHPNNEGHDALHYAVKKAIVDLLFYATYERSTGGDSGSDDVISTYSYDVSDGSDSSVSDGPVKKSWFKACF